MTNMDFTHQLAGNETLTKKKTARKCFLVDNDFLELDFSWNKTTSKKKEKKITETKQNKPVLSTRISRWSTDDMLLKVRRLKDADGVAKGAFYLFILSSRFHWKHRRDLYSILISPSIQLQS